MLDQAQAISTFSNIHNGAGASMHPAVTALVATVMFARSTYQQCRGKAPTKGGKVSITTKQFELTSGTRARKKGDDKEATYVRALSDSGANVTVFNKRSHFLPNSLHKPGRGDVRVVRTASGRSTKVKYIGDVAIDVATTSGKEVLIIKNALYAPEFELNIISE